MMVQRKNGQILVTRDSSWYNSQWHGKTYGLEVDPLSTVCTCSMSLCSQFELNLRGVFGTETHDERNAH